MSRELLAIPEFLDFLNDVQDKLRDYKEVTAHSRDFNEILTAQGAIEALEWATERATEDDVHEQEEDQFINGY